MESDRKIYEGRVSALTMRFEPVQFIEFKIYGSDVLLVADNRYLLDLKPGHSIYAVCRHNKEETAIVQELIHRPPGKEISQSDKTELLARLGATAVPYAATTWGKECDDFHRASLKEAREEYAQAIKAGTANPVIFVCPIDLYRHLRPEGRDYRSDFWEALAGESGGMGLALVVEEHGHLHEGLLLYSPGAAMELGPTPDPARPFRIVVMTRGGTKIYTEPEPA